MNIITLLKTCIPIFETVPLELIDIILMYIKMLDTRDVLDLSIFCRLSDSYRLLFLQNDFLRGHYYSVRKMAHLTLSVFIPERRQFAQEIIVCMFETFDLNGFYISGSDSDADDKIPSPSLLFKNQLMEQDTFFKPDIVNRHMIKFREQLFRVALWTNRLVVLKQMCTKCPDHLGELLCYFSEKFDLKVSWKYLGMLASTNDGDTITYIFQHCKKYRERLQNQNSQYFTMMDAALRRGHFDLAKRIIDQCSYGVFCKFDKLLKTKIIQCLMRLGHIPYLRSVIPDIKNMTMRYIFSHNNYFQTLPKINLETYEFCIQIYGKPTITDMIFYKRQEIFVDEIFEEIEELLRKGN
jgi:hypothetical protein